jgi:HPt (histidine-containing phosphotransfer) domain-containing protein
MMASEQKIVRRAVTAAVPVTPPAPGAAATLPPAGHTHPSPPLDYRSALDQCGGDPRLLREVVGDFTRQAASDLAKMERALAAGGAEDVRRAAHSLKGSASYLCAEALFRRAQELEDLGRACLLEEGASRVDELRREVDRCASYIIARSGPGHGEESGSPATPRPTDEVRA